MIKVRINNFIAVAAVQLGMQALLLPNLLSKVIGTTLLLSVIVSCSKSWWQWARQHWHRLVLVAVWLVPVVQLGNLTLVLAQIHQPAAVANVVIMHRRLVVAGFGGLWLVGGLMLSAKQLPWWQALKKFSKILAAIATIKVAWWLIMAGSWSWWLAVRTNIVAQGGLLVGLAVLYCLQAAVLYRLVFGRLVAALPEARWHNYVYCVGVWLLVGGGWLVQQRTLTQLTVPQMIAHRGVTTAKQTPNTLATLKQTASLRRHLRIEFDVQATSDRHFVVSHDPVAAHKVINHTPIRKLNLPHLQTYLRTASQAHQPLLLEIKRQSYSNSNQVQWLIQQYLPQLRRNHVWVHSFDVSAINTMRRHHVVAGVIIPFGLISYPHLAHASSFYSYGHWFVTQTAIATAEKNKQAVFVWTVNQPLLAWRIAQLHPQAEITDNALHLTQVLTHVRYQTQATASLISWCTSWW